MPHQCVRCGTLYHDGSESILKGCSCGAKLFFFVRKESLEKAKAITTTLSVQQKEQIEQDVLELVDEERKDEEEPIILDFEAIRVVEPGKFELDLVHLFKNDPLVYKLAEGKYVIDLATTFKSLKDEGEKRK